MAGGDRKNAGDRLALELAAGRTISRAAELAGVSERTVYRRLQEADFKKAVGACRAEMISRATGMISNSSAKAVRTLMRLLTAQSEQVALGAAKAILELGPKMRESTEMEERIALLEERANGQPQATRRAS